MFGLYTSVAENHQNAGVCKRNLAVCNLRPSENASKGILPQTPRLLNDETNKNETISLDVRKQIRPKNKSVLDHAAGTPNGVLSCKSCTSSATLFKYWPSKPCFSAIDLVSGSSSSMSIALPPE